MGLDRAGMHRRAAVFAALVAVVFNILLPQGFMPAGQGAPGLVLCTGSGPVRIASDLGAPAAKPVKTPNSKSGDGPCAFAGHGAAPPLSAAPILASEAAVWSPVARPAQAAPAPNLALAAPPPQSHAPPAAPI
jgi:hypothetical protein